MERFFWTLWQSPYGFWVRWLLRPLSWPMAAGSFCKNLAYDWKLLHPKKYAPRVISVGNITVGGTGKTPFLQLIARKGTAIVSRGYRSWAEKPGLILDELSSFEDRLKAGDEAELLYRHLEEPLLFIGRDRHSSMQEAEKRGVRTVFLDDGLQKRSLARDVEVILLDAHNPFGRGAFLPSGFLRDNPSALKRADFLVVSDCLDPESFERKWIKSIRHFTKAPIIYTEASYNLRGLVETPVALFAGIANPRRFEEAARRLGLEVVYTKWLPDHAPLTPEFVEKIKEEGKKRGAKTLVCTEKDWVKVQDKTVAFLEMRLNVLPASQEAYELLMGTI